MTKCDEAIEEIKRFEKFDKLEKIREEKKGLIFLIKTSTTLNKYWKDLFFRVLELERQEKEFE